MNIPALFHSLLYVPIFEILKFLAVRTGNFGVAIILLTVIIRLLLIPLSLPTMKSQKKMRDLKPELDKLKNKHKNDQKALQLAQMELYKQHNINPFAGCLPYILQIVVIIALYSVLHSFVPDALKQGFVIQTQFLGLDLSKTDPTHIIPVLAVITQLILSFMILPGREHHAPAHTPATKNEGDTQEMAETMQKQMVFMMPLMTGWVAWGFPAGLGLYWVVTTVFSIVQQWVISGPGGLLDVVHTIREKLHV
jgi:YidC/Oxa1 family membrane protein insertase